MVGLPGSSRSGERTTAARSGERTTAARSGERTTAGLSSGLSTARGGSTDCRLSSRSSHSNDYGGMMCVTTRDGLITLSFRRYVPPSSVVTVHDLGMSPTPVTTARSHLSCRRTRTLSPTRCALLHFALLQYINHLIWLVSCTFLTSPDNSDHLPPSSFLFPEQN